MLTKEIGSDNVVFETPESKNLVDSVDNRIIPNGSILGSEGDFKQPCTRNVLKEITNKWI